jgi:taurine--2-oxoglutarate transaminase
MTLGKGLTSGYAPLGAVALRNDLADRFGDKVLQCGLTHYAHPISCAAACATLDTYVDQDLIGNSARLGPLLGELLAGLKAKHPQVVGDVRNLGLWGTLELVDDPTTRAPLVGYNQGPGVGTPAARFKALLAEKGLHILFKWNFLFVAPPLCIDERDLRHGLSLIDDALTEVFR